MRNLKFKTKKIIAMFLVALSIYTSIFSSAVLPVQASTFPLATEFVSAMLQVFGYTWGFGTSADGMNNTSSEMFAEMQAKWNAGESFEVDGTEIPDLRNAANFTNFVYNSYDFYTGYNNGGITNEYMTQLNEKSFKATGTLVTKTFMDSLALAKDYCDNTASDVLTTELETAFNALTDDDAEISGMNTLSLVFGTVVAGIAAKCQVDDSNAWIQPVTSNVYTDDYKLFTTQVDGNDLNFIRTANVRVNFSDGTYFIYELSVPVYACAVYSSGYQFLYLIAFEPFNYVRKYYNSSGICTDTYNGVQDFAFKNNNYPGVSMYRAFESYRLAYKSTTCPLHNFLPSDDVVYPLMFASSDFLSQELSCTLLGNYDSVDASVTDALKSYSGRAVTKSKLLELSDMLEERAGTAAGTETAVSEIASTITEAAAVLPEAGTGTGTGSGDYSSILDKILAAIQAIAAAIWGFFSEPLTGIKSAIDIFPDMLDSLGEKILTIPKSMWDYLESYIANIEAEVSAIAQENKNPWDNDDTDRSSDSVSLLNGFYFLIIIIIKLLEIFWHCLQFIVAIFEIQPSTRFLPEEVIMGLDYLKTLEITGIGLSVYDFLMGLVYILIVFSVVRVLRKNIDRIHVPGHGIKKAS